MKQFMLLIFLPLFIYAQSYQVKVVPIGNKEVNGNINVATLTLIFETNSIGKDIEAARMIAEKEALKIGADSITFISSTVYGSNLNTVELSLNGDNKGNLAGSKSLSLSSSGTEDVASYTCRAIKKYSPTIPKTPKKSPMKMVISVTLGIGMALFVILMTTHANSVSSSN